MVSVLPYTHLLTLFFQLPFSTIAQTCSNIHHSLITAQDNGSFWASPSGEFAFGFQQVAAGGFLLAIWFNKIPEKTIILSANGNNLVQMRIQSSAYRRWPVCVE